MCEGFTILNLSKLANCWTEKTFASIMEHLAGQVWTHVMTKSWTTYLSLMLIFSSTYAFPPYNCCLPILPSVGHKPSGLATAITKLVASTDRRTRCGWIRMIFFLFRKLTAGWKLLMFCTKVVESALNFPLKLVQSVRNHLGLRWKCKHTWLK